MSFTRCLKVNSVFVRLHGKWKRNVDGLFKTA